jgi:hypothetical protein
VRCEKGAATMEGEEMSLASREGLKLGGRGKLSGALASCQRVAEAGEGEWLLRSADGCHKLPGMREWVWLMRVVVSCPRMERIR